MGMVKKLDFANTVLKFRVSQNW